MVCLFALSTAEWHKSEVVSCWIIAVANKVLLQHSSPSCLPAYLRQLFLIDAAKDFFMKNEEAEQLSMIRDHGMDCTEGIVLIVKGNITFWDFPRFLDSVPTSNSSNSRT